MRRRRHPLGASQVSQHAVRNTCRMHKTRTTSATSWRSKIGRCGCRPSTASKTASSRFIALCLPTETQHKARRSVSPFSNHRSASPLSRSNGHHRLLATRAPPSSVDRQAFSASRRLVNRERSRSLRSLDEASIHLRRSKKSSIDRVPCQPCRSKLLRRLSPSARMSCRCSTRSPKSQGRPSERARLLSQLRVSHRLPGRATHTQASGISLDCHSRDAICLLARVLPHYRKVSFSAAPSVKPRLLLGLRRLTSNTRTQVVACLARSKASQTGQHRSSARAKVKHPRLRLSWAEMAGRSILTVIVHLFSAPLAKQEQIRRRLLLRAQGTLGQTLSRSRVESHLENHPGLGLVDSSQDFNSLPMRYRLTLTGRSKHPSLPRSQAHRRIMLTTRTMHQSPIRFRHSTAVI